MKKIVLAVIVLGLLGFAYYTISPLWRNIESNEASPLATLPETDTEALNTNEEQQTTDGVLATADFIPKAHDVEGRAQLIKIGDEYTVRFEDFKTINGPDVQIYLATDTSADDFVDLGDIKATDGNVNYVVPAGTDVQKYDTVLVWCKAFSVLFSYAELQQSL